MKNYYWLSLSLLFIFSCTPVKKYEEVRFGRAGGFANEKTIYTIKSNGEVYKKEGEKAAKMVNTLTKKELKKVYKSLDNASIETVELNQPDNIYFFIELQETTEQPTVKKIVWGKPEKTPETLVELQKTLMELIKE